MSPGVISGEEGTYAPCDDLPAELPPLPEGSIVGEAAGFVSRDVGAATLPPDPRGVVVGSQVGFVPKECEEEECVDGRQVYVVDTFQRLEITEWGTAQGTYTGLIPPDDWVKEVILGTTTESVDGAYGIAGGDGSEPLTRSDLFLGIPTEWTSGKAWIECRWLVSLPTSGTTWGLINANVDPPEAIAFGVSLFGANVTITYRRRQGGVETFQFSQTGTTVANFTAIPFWVALRLEETGGFIRCKAWRATDSEPVDWEINPLSGSVLDVDDITHCYHTAGQYPAKIDYIEITVPC